MKALSPLRLLALPAVILAVTPSCKKASEARNDPEWWRLEGDRVELAHSVDLLKLKMGSVTASHNELAAAANELRENSARLQELKAIATEMRGEVAYLVSRAAEERENWVRSTRAAAMGKELGTLVGRGGRSYENVVVTKITDIGIEFRHSNGSARLPAAHLTSEQQVAFCLDPEVALAALAKEKEKAKVYEDWIGGQILVANDAKAASEQAAADRQAERELVAARARSQAIEDRLSAVASERSSRLRDEPRSVGPSYWGGYYRVRSGYSRYYYPSSYSSCNSGVRWAYGTGSCSSSRSVGSSPCQGQVRPLNFSQKNTSTATTVP